MTSRARRSFALALAAGVAACGDGEAPGAVTVVTAAGPAADVEVVFHDADGLPIDHVTTDADGRAAAHVEDGGMVTVLSDAGPARFRATFVGIAAGDELRVEIPWTAAVEPLGTVYVTLAPYPGAAVYVIETACAAVYFSDPSEPIPVDITSRCLSSDGRFHLLVSAWDLDGGPMACASVRDLAWTDPMDVTMPVWGPMANLAVTATDPAAGTVGVLLAVGYEVNDLFIRGPQSAAVLGAGQGASLAVRYAPEFGDRVSTEIAAAFGDTVEDVDGLSWIAARSDAPPASRTVDLAVELLPRIAVDAYDTSDPARPSLGWSSDGDLAALDGGAVRFWWDEPDSAWESWTLLVPGDASSARLPALPAELAAWTPAAATLHHDARIDLLDLDSIESYEQMRQDVGLGFEFGDDRALYPRGEASVRFTRAGAL